MALRGAIAAALTPLRDDGARLDEEAFGPYCDFLAGGGLDGVLALGTTGEALLLSIAERMRVVELFLEHGRGRLLVAAQCGAQSTADTVELAEHAAGAGADAVVVICPPYFRLDERSQLAHLSAAATACAPVPFYVYEFARASGYAVSLDVLARLRERTDNFVGLKVSDTPWEAWEPYLLGWLDVFVGPEAFIHRGIERGAVGAVSALASAFPEEVSAVVRAPTAAGEERVGALRAHVERFPRHAALKHVVARRGVSLQEAVRAPLRGLISEERADLDGWLDARAAAAA
jgi:dihydrodipicolinate synthase/N-acetylneuraminate lyase